jgi:hypothetical protein
MFKFSLFFPLFPLYNCNQKNKKMKTKIGFEVLKLVDIPRVYLLPTVLKELEGRANFNDVDDDIGESIYSGDVFDKILEEQDGLGVTSLKRDRKAFKQVKKLAEDLRDYELVRVVAI